MLIYALIIYVVIKSYLILTIYQQSYYDIKSYLKHFVCNFFFYDALILLVLGLSLLTNNIAVLSMCSIVIIFYSLIYLYLRKHLKFTHRILRLFIYLIIYILLIGFIPVVNVWLYALIEFTILQVLFL
jgi:hypothetical protein